MGHSLLTAALEVSDARRRTAAGADGAAVGGQAANAGLLMQRHQIRQRHRSKELVLGNLQTSCKDHHRHAGGDALIAGAGANDDGHFAAAHPGVGARRRIGAGLLLKVPALMVQHDGADVGAPVAGQALFGDGHVVLDLAAHQRADIFHIHAVGKLHDPRHTEAGLVCQTLFRGIADGLLQEDFTILFQQNDVGMVVDNPDARLLPLGFQGQINVENQVRGGRLDVQLYPIHVVPDGGVGLLGHLADNLQLPVRVTGHDAGTDRRGHAVKAPRVGHDDTLDIFDDVAADQQIDLLRQAAEDLSSLGSGIGQGDGLGAAHGGLQLLCQDVQILLIQDISFFHGAFSLQ